MALPDAHLLLYAIVAASISLMLIRPRNIPEAWWVGSGALLLVGFRLISLSAAARAVANGSDVYLFLLGMMLLSGLGREYGVFHWVSCKAVRGAHGRSSRLFLLVYAAGALVTACLSNDATAVVLTPAILAAVRKAKASPLPYLFACAMIANAASFVLPISNPANLVVFHRDMPPLARWLAVFELPSILSIAVTYLVLRLYFRSSLRAPVEMDVEDVRLTASGKFVLGGLGLVVALLLTVSALRMDLGLPTCLAALLIVALLSIKERSSPIPLAGEVSWATLVLVAGLFVMVRAVEAYGALGYTQAALAWLRALGPGSGALATAFGVGAANNLINNLPLGLLAGTTLRAAGDHGLLANATLIGVDLGPNLSVTGSLATILWLIAIRTEGLHVSAVDFLKAGLLAMPAAILASVGGLLFLHAAFRI